MEKHTVTSRDEWLAARLEPLKWKEEAHAAQRRERVHPLAAGADQMH